jgi:hypothetical protein
VSGSDAGARHHFADEFYTFAVVVAAVSGADGFIENAGRPLADSSVEFSAFWIAIEPATRRVTRTFAYAGSTVSERVDVSSMSATMRNVDRVLRRGRIQVFATKRPAVTRLSIIVLETEYPLTSGSFRSALANCSLNVSD